MRDEFDDLSASDRRHLYAMHDAWWRGGEVALAAALERFATRYPDAYVRIWKVLDPRAVRAAVEDALIDAGLTNAELHAMSANAMQRN